MSIQVKITAADHPVTVTLKDGSNDNVLAVQEVAPTQSHDFIVDAGVALSAVDSGGDALDIGFFE